MIDTVEYISLAEASGYGLSAQCYMRALEERGVEVLWLPLFDSPRGYQDKPDEGELEYRVKKLQRMQIDCGLFNIAPRTRGYCRNARRDVVLHHTIPELWDLYLDPRVVNVGYTVWETTAIPDHWNAICQRMERVLVPSAFSKAAFCRTQPEGRVRVVPHIAREIRSDSYGARYFRERHGIPTNHYVFYTISAWSIRKAPWGTLNAYLQAFTNKDPVTLVIKTDVLGDQHYDSRRRGRTRGFVERIVSNYPDAPSIRLIDHEIPCDEIDALHTTGGCYVALPHAEGWCLGAFEAATAGNPVVITGWGGQLDYLPPESAFLVDYSLRHVRHNLAPRSYSPDQHWAWPDVDDAVDKLRWIFQNQEAARERAAGLQGTIKDKYNARRVGGLLADALSL
ncbi:MAG: hypothetical protein WB783_10815 [Arenicellales bacterium]